MAFFLRTQEDEKELNLVSWNDSASKYDLRDWDSNQEKMGKGVTLTEDEIQKLKMLLNAEV